MGRHFSKSILTLLVGATFLFPQENANASSWFDLLKSLLGRSPAVETQHRPPRPTPKPTPKPTPAPQCDSEAYSATYKSRQACSSWPFAGRSFHESHFWNWFDDGEGRSWSGKTIYFDNLDKKKTSKAHLDSVTLKFRTVVFDYEDWDLDHVKIAMNGYEGVPLSANAVEFKVIERNSVRTRAEKHSYHQQDYKSKLGRPKKARGRRNDVELVEVTFHLEKFVFGLKKTAADLLRLSAQGRGTVHFRIRHLHTRFRLFDVSLLVKGSLPGECPVPTPTPTPTPTPGPTPTPTPGPTPTPTPTPTPVPTPTPTPTPVPVVQIDSTSVGALTNQTNFSAAFSANVAATFQCSLDGSVYSECLSPYTTSGLSDGVHHFSVQAVNGGGTSLPAQFDWTVDATSPTVKLGNVVPPEEETNQTQITIPFDADEAVTFECRLNSSVWMACSSPMTVNHLTDGSHWFFVRATDLAGNRSVEVAYNWAVKTVPPTVVITQETPAANPTNATSRSFTFTGSSDTKSFRCSIDSGAKTNCSSPFEATQLADGGHQFAVWGYDRVGNESQPAVRAFVVDTVNPVVIITSIVPAQTVTNQSSLEVNFSADESAIFACSLDGQAMGSCTSPIIYSGLSDGPHSFVVMANDPAGNPSAPVTYNWTVDTVAPEVSLVSANPSATLFNQTQITLQFAVSEAAQVSCRMDQQAATDCSSLTVSYADLTDGDHQVIVSAVDSAGNRGSDFVYRFSVDTTKPQMAITQVNPSEALSNQTSISVDFVANQPIAQTLCQIDGGNYDPCSSPKSWSGLGDGSHTINIIGVDAAGNMSASPASYTWTIDTLAPITQITGQTPSGGHTATSTITFSFAANENAVYECTLDGVGPTPCSSPITYNGLADGTHTFSVLAVDLVGNREAVGASRSWSINTQPFVIGNVQVTGVSRNSATITWTTSAPGNSTVYFAQGSSGNFIPVTSHSMTTTHTVTLTGLSAFTLYTYYVQSTSQAGQTATSGQSSFRTLR